MAMWNRPSACRVLLVAAQPQVFAEGRLVLFDKNTLFKNSQIRLSFGHEVFDGYTCEDVLNHLRQMIFG